jgi:hypothetical protein
MSIVLLSADLTCSSRAAGVASQLGFPCTTAMSVAALDDRLVAGTRLVVIDLSTAGVVPSVLVPKIRTALTPRPQIVAFGPHVHGELLEEAETSGCDIVVSRGEFFARMPELMSRGASASAE